MGNEDIDLNNNSEKTLSISEKKLILNELNHKQIDLYLEEKNRLEKWILFIIKTYIFIFGFLFIYTAYVGKSFLFVNKIKTTNNDNLQEPFAYFGLILILIILLFGKYAVRGISHAINKRLYYTNKIHNAIKEIYNLTNAPYLDKVKLDIRQFIYVPGVYTWTSIIVVIGSLFYFHLIFSDNNTALSLAMWVSIISLSIFPDVNVEFYNSLKKQKYELLNEYNDFNTTTKKEKNILKNIKVIKKSLIFIFIVLEMFKLHYSDITSYYLSDYNLYYLDITNYYLNDHSLYYLYGSIFIILIVIEYIRIRILTIGYEFINLFKFIKNIYSININDEAP